MIDPAIVRAAREVNPLYILPPELRVRKRGLDKFMVQCPFHDDSNPSLDFEKCTDGSWRYRCYGCGEKGDSITMVMKTRDMTFVEAVNLLKLCAQNGPEKERIVAEYSYTDAEGEELYQIVRYEPKNFRQRRKLKSGEWCWKKPDKYVLYKLHMLKPRHLVYVVEGEKDVEALLERGRIATTWPCGASQWRDEYAQQLKGLEVVVIPDNDDVGRAAGRRVWDSVGPVASRMGHVILSVGKDVSDYFAAGKTVEDLEGEIRWR